MLLQNKERLFGPDAVRCTACLLVLSVHFFLHTGFYQEPVKGGLMYLLVILRSACMICVPLFLLLTGYLMRNKKPEARYYTKCIKTIMIYLMASVISISAKLVLDKDKVDPKIAWMGILDFSGAQYGWYIEMYLGLFLLIPFLNTMFHALPSQKARRMLLITLLVMTALPSVVNCYSLINPDLGAKWWAHPSLSTSYQSLIPRWWKSIYPLTYYFIGVYIGEYNVKVRPVRGRLLLVAATLANGLYNCWRSAGESCFIWGEWTEWGSVLNLLPAVAAFLILINKDGSKRPATYKMIVSVAAELSLGIFLVSYVFERMLYQMLTERVPVTADRYKYFLIMVPAVFLFSFVQSLEMEVMYRLGEAGVKMLIARFQKKKPPSGSGKTQENPLATTLSE